MIPFQFQPEKLQQVSEDMLKEEEKIKWRKCTLKPAKTPRTEALRKRQKARILLQLDDESGIVNQYRQRLLQRRVQVQQKNMAEWCLQGERWSTPVSRRKIKPDAIPWSFSL